MWWLRNAQTANHTTLAKPEAEPKQDFESWFAIRCNFKSNVLESIVSLAPSIEGSSLESHLLFSINQLSAC